MSTAIRIFRSLFCSPPAADRLADRVVFTGGIAGGTLRAGSHDHGEPRAKCTERNPDGDRAELHRPRSILPNLRHVHRFWRKHDVCSYRFVYQFRCRTDERHIYLGHHLCGHRNLATPRNPNNPGRHHVVLFHRPRDLDHDPDFSCLERDHSGSNPCRRPVSQWGRNRFCVRRSGNLRRYPGFPMFGGVRRCCGGGHDNGTSDRAGHF